MRAVRLMPLTALLPKFLTFAVTVWPVFEQVPLAGSIRVFTPTSLLGALNLIFISKVSPFA